MQSQKWLQKVKVGDIVRSGSGTERVVRHVSRWKNTTCLTFSIIHCSWTKRCYTVYFSNDLKQMGYRPTGKRVELTSEMDKKIAKAIEKADLSHRNGRAPNCCSVHGIR